MALEAWAKYFRTPAERRRKLLNVVSLSLAGTPLEVSEWGEELGEKPLNSIG